MSKYEYDIVEGANGTSSDTIPGMSHSRVSLIRHELGKNKNNPKYPE